MITIIKIVVSISRFLVLAGMVEYIAPGLSYEATKYIVEVLVT